MTEPESTDGTVAPDDAEVDTPAVSDDADTVRVYVVQEHGFPQSVNLATADGTEVLHIGSDPIEIDPESADAIIEQAAALGITVAVVPDDDSDDDENGEQ